VGGGTGNGQMVWRQVMAPSLNGNRPSPLSEQSPSKIPGRQNERKRDLSFNLISILMP
jgi:hypothetical protein